MNKRIDFIAELKYKTTERGGRKTPASSGYRPTVKFNFSDQQSSGSQIFIGTDEVYPGETVLAEITVVSPQFFESQLEIGLEFDFREGSTIIGFGKVIEIKNKMLERSSAST